MIKIGHLIHKISSGWFYQPLALYLHDIQYFGFPVIESSTVGACSALAIILLFLLDMLKGVVSPLSTF